MYPWLLSVSAARPPCSVQAKDAQRRTRAALQFFHCAQEVPEGEATFTALTGYGSPTADDCWFQRIPIRDLDPAVVAGEANISILAVVTGGACGGPKALGFTAGSAVRNYFVLGPYRLVHLQWQKPKYPADIVSCYCESLGTPDATPDQWHLIQPYFQSVGTSIAAIAFHMGGAEHSDNGFIIAGPRRQSVAHGGDGFSADGSGTFASFYRGPEATKLPVWLWPSLSTAARAQRVAVSERSSSGGQHSSRGLSQWPALPPEAKAAAAASSCSSTSMAWPITRPRHGPSHILRASAFVTAHP